MPMKKENKNSKSSSSKIKEKKAGKRKNTGFGVSLKAQLIVGFLIPLALVLFIGIYASSTAEKGMVNNSQETTSQALEMTMDYMDFGFETVYVAAMELYNDTELLGYSRGAVSPTDAAIMVQEYTANLMAKQVGNRFIENIHFIPKSDYKALTSAKMESAKEKNGFYDVLFAEHESVIKAKKREEKWCYGHPTVDEIFGQSAEDVAVSVFMMNQLSNACIIVDVSAENIMEIMQGTGLGEGSIVGFITADKHELITGLNAEGGCEVPIEGFSFLNQSYCKWNRILFHSS